MEQSFTSLLYSPLPQDYEHLIERKARNDKWEQHLVWLERMKNEELLRKEELEEKEKQKSYLEDILIPIGLDNDTEALKTIDARLLEMARFENSFVEVDQKKLHRKQQTKKISQHLEKKSEKVVKKVDLEDREVSRNDLHISVHSKLQDDLFDIVPPKRKRGRPFKKQPEQITPIRSSRHSNSTESPATKELGHNFNSEVPLGNESVPMFSKEVGENDQAIRANQAHVSPISSHLIVPSSNVNSFDHKYLTTPTSLKHCILPPLPPLPRLQSRKLTRIQPSTCSPLSSPSKKPKEHRKTSVQIDTLNTDDKEVEKGSNEV